MTKVIRKKDKNGKDLVVGINPNLRLDNTVITDQKEIAKILNGKTPRQHCEPLAKRLGHGSEFIAGDDFDICKLYSPVADGGMKTIPKYEYYYDYIKLMATVDGKYMEVDDLVRLSGGEYVVIHSNRPLNWTVSSKNVPQGQKNSFEFIFKMPEKLEFSISVIAVNAPELKRQFKVRSQPTGRLILSAQDIEDIIKVTSTEADLNVKKYASQRELERQIEGVVDTVLNRAYLEKQKDGAVRRVINAPKQFTDISEKYHGKVQNMPLSDIKPEIAKYAEQYLLKRVNSSESIIGGNYNYLNPKKVKNKKNEIPEWARPVIHQAERNKLIFGPDPYSHYHGTAENEKRAPKFQVVLPKDYKTRWYKK